MSEERFTKENADFVIESTEEIMKAFPKGKFVEFVVHFNDLMLFLESAKKEAPILIKKDE